jgi:hypothetical protein
VNERVSDALLAGAREATMIDIVPLGHSLWKDFEARCKDRNVSGYKCISADATRAGLREQTGTFEVVHCSGVIYHVPDLVGFLTNLMSITTRHLIVQSMVVPEYIENEFGILDLSGGHCLFIPLMSETQRKIAGRYLEQLDLRVPNLSAEPVRSWRYGGVWNYAPWCWLITPQFLRGLVEVCGLSVIDEGFAWEQRVYSVLCERQRQ